MAAKHEKNERIRKLSPIFFQIGLLTALLITFGAFRWTVAGEAIYVEDEGYLDTTTFAYGEIKLEPDKKTEEFKKEKLVQPKPDPNRIKINEKNEAKEEKDKKQDEKQNEYNPFLETLMKNRPKFEEDPEFLNVAPLKVASQMPEYPGGETELVKFIKKNYVVPPIVIETMRRSSLSLSIQCVIEKDGSISNIVVTKDGGYPEAGEELMRVVKLMPRWSPGFQGAHAVRVYMAIPMKIKIK